MSSQDATLDLSLLRSLADAVFSETVESETWHPWHDVVTQSETQDEATLYGAGITAAVKMKQATIQPETVQVIQDALVWASTQDKTVVQAFLQGFQGYWSRKLLCTNKRSVK